MLSETYKANRCVLAESPERLNGMQEKQTLMPREVYDAFCIKHTGHYKRYANRYKCIKEIKDKEMRKEKGDRNRTIVQLLGF